MDNRSLKALEFDHLLEILKTFSISPPGQRRCMALRPTRDHSLIESRLTAVIELKEILETQGDIPLRGLKDIEAILKRLEVEGSVLDVQEILNIYQQMVLVKGLRGFFLKSEIRASSLQEKISRLSSLKALAKEILQAINTKGEILDRASPGLSDVRHHLGTAREKAKRTLEHLLHQEDLQPIFQEHLITLRNGRYVLLVKSDSKHRLKGIIHDQSHSHMSLFFEPLEVVPFNNEINILMAEEKEEEYRILTDLSEKMRKEIQPLRDDFEILGELDLLYAMARLSLLLRSVKPELNGEEKIVMREARNPLLSLQKEGQIIPVDLRMGESIRTLIISGANAGGKTVALKTLGLLTLMVQSGLPIPVSEGSQAAIFEEVFAVIGDEQSMEENLSTFSAHLLHVNQILEKAGPHSLVLLDELGVGTHASEGSALAMGFLDLFREKGASVVVTTHFDGLKAYGYLYPDVENVSVEFDEKTLEPRYTLSYGTSGLSNAFLVAEKLGVSEKVLEQARHHRNGSGQEILRALERLEGLKADAEKQRLQWIRMKEEADQDHQRLKDILDRIRSRRQEILSLAEEKAKKTAQKVEEELKAWLRRQKEEKVPSQIRRKEIQEIREKFFPSIRKKGPHTKPGGLKIGDRVRIESLRSSGILLKVEEALNRAEVMTEKARVVVPLTDLARAIDGGGKEETERPLAQSWPHGNVREIPAQLNVIGLTIEDALPVVDKFIDQALFHGLEKVQIIHGVGSGRLRNAIGKYLDNHQGVKCFTPGEAQKGGKGITVVELR
ncbi:MAG: endonuclease MutS2 [Thermodesulfobacteriota bacterium]|nr:endonuclease MutS2 [Thermodesulfobacteriota bacterium]